MKRARLMASVTACWLTAVQPLFRRLMILPWRLMSFFKQLEILVVDVHRPRTLPLDKEGILLLAADLRLRAALADAIDLKLTCHEDSVTGKWFRKTLTPTPGICSRMRGNH